MTPDAYNDATKPRLKNVSQLAQLARISPIGLLNERVNNIGLCLT